MSRTWARSGSPERTGRAPPKRSRRCPKATDLWSATLAVKGGAIGRFVAQAPFHGRMPVFLGDETSDETGFEAVNEMGSVSVRVKEREETSAAFMLADVKAVIGWLQHQFPA